MDIEIKSLIELSKPTSRPGIYEYLKSNISQDRNTLFVITGPTGSGKSTFIECLSSKFPRIQTATTRTKRASESMDTYLWMNETINKNESREDYQIRLVSKYGLVESDYHEANLYGVPGKNLINVLKESHSIIGIEKNGVQKLKALVKDKYNLICFFILPDNFEQITERISKDRNDIVTRIEFAKDEIATSIQIANYFVHNTEMNIYSGSEDPLEYMKNNLNEFIYSLIGT